MFFSLIHGYSIDCGPLADLASSFGMDSDSVSNLRNNNCCSPNTNIECSGAPFYRVEFIYWAYMGFSGTFNSVALNSLTKLTYLEVYGNNIRGSLPTSFPLTLTYLDVSPNSMTGPIPTFHNGMQLFWGDYNYFTGNLPAFPSSMQTVYLSGLQITGTLSMTSPFPIAVYIDGTLISRVVITNPTSFGQVTTSNKKCDISGSKVYQEDAAYLSPYCLMDNLLTRPITTVIPSKTTTRRITTTTTSLKLSTLSTILFRPTTVATSRIGMSIGTTTDIKSALTSTKLVQAAITSILPNSVFLAIPSMTAQSLQEQVSQSTVNESIIIHQSNIPPNNLLLTTLSLSSQTLSDKIFNTVSVESLVSPSRTLKSTLKIISSKAADKLTQVRTKPKKNLFLNTGLPDLESIFSYAQLSEVYPYSTQAKNSSISFFSVERMLTNPIFYFGIGLFIFFLFGMLVMREIQRKKRLEAKAAKKAKKNGGQTELSFHI